MKQSVIIRGKMRLKIYPVIAEMREQ